MIIFPLWEAFLENWTVSSHVAYYNKGVAVIKQPQTNFITEKTEAEQSSIWIELYLVVT